MTLLLKSNNCSIIDHRDYTLNLYKHVLLRDDESQSFGLLTKLFSILNNKKACRKRTHDCNDFHAETIMLREKYDTFFSELDNKLKQTMNSNYNILNTTAVRDLSQELLKSTVFDHVGMNGGNNLDRPMKCAVKGDYFLIPPKSRFFSGCVKEQCLRLNGNKYDIIVADPPWWNKYIRRLKDANKNLSYSMMYNEDIASIPVRNLLSENCLVAVWCTNAPSNISAVKDIIFPSWGVEYVTTWYWLKVTVDLKPLCAFSSGSRKQPYERLILGKTGSVKQLPNCHLFMSIPSALHSHKPPLLDLLSPYVNMENPQILELFARYLLPNTTSVGYEPLKWQHESLYETVT